MASEILDRQQNQPCLPHERSEAITSFLRAGASSPWRDMMIRREALLRPPGGEDEAKEGTFLSRL